MLLHPQRRLVGAAAEPAALSLVQWNVLADRLAFGSFVRASEDCLRWDGATGRRRRILDVLSQGFPDPPDVICLQEVDHHEALAAQLAEWGYAGAHAPKAAGRDGCSLFVREERARIVATETLRFRDDSQRPETQLALIARLEGTAPGAPAELCIATTHLKARLGFEATRERQARQLFDSLPGDVPTIVAGDFNDVPGSPAYEVAAASLSSAYVGVLGREPAWTTWKVREAGEVRRTIDYVWHTPDLSPLAALDVPPDAAVGAGRLPSEQYPSDHLSLAVRFDLT